MMNFDLWFFYQILFLFAGGAGGKGVWGKPGSELDETGMCQDIRDPNYDSDNQVVIWDEFYLVMQFAIIRRMYLTVIIEKKSLWFVWKQKSLWFVGGKVQWVVFREQCIEFSVNYSCWFRHYFIKFPWELPVCNAFPGGIQAGRSWSGVEWWRTQESCWANSFGIPGEWKLRRSTGKLSLAKNVNILIFI